MLLTSLLLLLISFVFSGFLFYEKRKMIFSKLPDEKKIKRFYRFSLYEMAFDALSCWPFLVLINSLWIVPEDSLETQQNSPVFSAILILTFFGFTGYGIWEWRDFKRRVQIDKESTALGDLGYANALLGVAKGFNVFWLLPYVQWGFVYGSPKRRIFFKEEGITLDIYSFFLPVDQDMKPFCYAEDFLIVYFLLAIIAAAGFGLWAKKKQLSESKRYLYMIVPFGLAILALASVMRVWTAAVFFLIILFGGYGVMLTSMAKHREDIQLTPKQIWGSASIAFVVMLLLRLVEYLVFKM